MAEGLLGDGSPTTMSSSKPNKRTSKLSRINSNRIGSPVDAKLSVKNSWQTAYINYGEKASYAKVMEKKSGQNANLPKKAMQ